MHKLLWVDDSADLFPGLRGHLGEHFDLDIATDLPTASHKIEHARYDAILLDLILPGGSFQRGTRYGGIAIARAVREKEKREGSGRRSRIVVLSVLSSAEVEPELRELDLQFFSKADMLLSGTETILKALGGGGA
jgi:CheY-like chemotaxis protein